MSSGGASCGNAAADDLFARYPWRFMHSRSSENARAAERVLIAERG
jgi:hypothetical protein